MVERLRWVDRNDNASGEYRGKIAYDPVDAVVGDQRHAIARLEAGIANRAGRILNAFEQTRGRCRRPRPRNAFE